MSGETREAAVQQVAEARSARWHADHEGTTFSLGWFLVPASMEAEDWWPLICQAREQHQRDLLNLRARLEAEHEEMQERAFEDGKVEGRRDAAEAIEGMAVYGERVGPRSDLVNRADAARVARGAQQPDEKERTDGQ